MRYLTYVLNIFAISCYGYAIYTLGWIFITGIPKSDFSTFGPWFVASVLSCMLAFIVYALFGHIKGMINDYKNPPTKKPADIKPKPKKKWTPPPLTDADKAVIAKVYLALIEADVLKEDEISLPSLEHRIEQEGISYDVDPGDLLVFIPEVALGKNIKLSNIAPLIQGSQIYPEDIRQMTADILRIMGYQIEAKDIKLKQLEGDGNECHIIFKLGDITHTIETRYNSKYPPDNLETMLQAFAPKDTGKKLYTASTDQMALTTFITPETADKLNTAIYNEEFKDEKFDRNIYFVGD